jgi:asparagine synthase (glutamine-hydrolysing)
MSGILGVWNLDGQPLDPVVLSRMSESLRHRGPDGEGRSVAGSMGFIHQHSWVTPEEQGEIQPLVGRADVMLIMDGRLDNRDELLRALELPDSVSDARCALEAYQTWDDGFAERLNGDFALAVFDPPKQRLILARDAIGIRPLYYVRSDTLFAFASEIKALLAHPEVPARPDDEGIADFLLVSSRPVDRQDITCFAGVSSVVAAHLAIVTPERIVTRRYWDFETGRVLRLPSFEDYAEAFRERFREAVRRRIRSAHPVVVSVSGGLDSSSVFCQAETLRRADQTVARALVGISYLGAPGTDADERRYLVDIERDYGVEIERFPIEPLQGVVHLAGEQVHAMEAPFLDYLWGVTRELHRRAVAHGSRSILSGQWGDQVLFSSAYLGDLARRFAWREIGRHRREYLRWIGAAAMPVISRNLVLDLARHWVPRSLLPPLKWARRRLLRVERQRRWFSKAFLRRALRFGDRPATLGNGFHSAHARSIYLEARSKYHVQCMEWNNKICASHGLDAAFPFLDRDLIRLLMAIPGEIQNRGGVPRALMREAMRGVLPDAIRARSWKADFSEIVNRGVAQDVPVLKRVLSDQALGVQLGYFDRARLAQEVSRLSLGLSRSDCVDSWDLADSFGLEVWLQLFLGGRRIKPAGGSAQWLERAG